MIWHIFRKDLSLLWRFALIVAAVHLVNALISVRLGAFMEPIELRVLGDIFPYLSMLGVLALTAIAVQQEPLTGTSEDFLVRPISRVDLMLAKVLFVALVVQGPVFVSDLIESAASGFDFITCIRAAASHGASVFLLLALPAMAMATITRSLTELIIGSLLLVVGCATLMLTLASVQIAPPALSASGLLWMRPTSIAVLFLVVAAFVLPAQYARRFTSASRAVVAVCAIATALLWSIIPWAPSFAVQQYVGAQSAETSSLAVSFAPQLGAARHVDGSLPLQSRGDPPNAVRVFLPLQIDGASGDALLHHDRTEFRIKTRDGRTLYQGAVRPISGNRAVLRAQTEAAREASSQDRRIAVYQELPIPGWLLSRYRLVDVRVELDQSLTVLRPQPQLTLAALPGKLATSELRCVTRARFDGDEIELGCLSTRKMPSCAMAYLQHSATGTRNPPREACVPNYSPFSFELAPHVVKRFGASLAFYDPEGVVTYPVNAQMVRDAKIVIVPYEAASHLSRHVETPLLRLADWQMRSD